VGEDVDTCFVGDHDLEGGKSVWRSGKIHSVLENDKYNVLINVDGEAVVLQEVPRKSVLALHYTPLSSKRTAAQ
jgi:hypothetical protein